MTEVLHTCSAKAKAEDEMIIISTTGSLKYELLAPVMWSLAVNELWVKFVGDGHKLTSS